MKKKITILFMLLVAFSAAINAQSSTDSLTLVNANWNWQNLGKGAKSGYVLVPMFGNSQSISVLKYPARKFHTSIIDAQRPDENITPVIAQKHKAKAAINASYFDTKKLFPATYFVCDGKIVGRTYPNELNRVNGYFAVKDKKGKQVEIAYVDTTKNEVYPQEYKSLITSGPIVLMNKQIPVFPHDKGFYDKRHPRTIIGYDNEGTIYYVVIDGRFPEQGAFGATIQEVALIARYLGMTYAINLDGGGSSTLWSKKTGVINHPSDNRKFDHEGCRKVPNIIMMK